MKPEKVLLTCPSCGHRQPEPPTAYSTVCKKCSQYFRVHEALHPPAKAEPVPKDQKQSQKQKKVICSKCGESLLVSPTAYSAVCKKCGQYLRIQDALYPPAKAAAAPADQPRPNQKQVACFKCGEPLVVPPAAQSTMCKRCSSHVDLRDYQVTNATSKNFKTKGRFVIEENGFLFNTETIVGEAVLKGRFLGKLTAERSLEIYTSAEIKGTFQTACLIIPPGNRFRWPETLQLVGAEIGGELVANLQATGTVRLKSSARFFGNVQAGGLVVEEGAVFVGMANIGRGKT
jgi:cytoskeletal protein CcmA (bactofilin family)/uncharacterized CHY-type Zn-finger protein